jgi:hypothetical protein
MGNPTCKLIVALSFFFILLASLPSNAQQKTAFKQGERLRYLINYGPIKGGEAILEVKAGAYEGKPANHLVLSGKTIGVANMLYGVHDTYQSFTNAKTDLPYKAIRDIKEGGYKHYSEQVFDHWTRSDSTIVYSSKVGEKLAPKNSNDILSAFYFLRNQLMWKPIKVGDTLTIQTYFTDEIYTLKVRFLGYDNIKMKIGTIRAMKFMPIVITGRVFKSQDDMAVWFSADRNFVPVRIKFDIVVGSVYCDLVDYNGLLYNFDALTKK